VAVLASVFTDAGGYGSPQAYVDGLVPAVWVGAAVLAVGALIALLVPGRRRAAVSAAEPGVLPARAADAEPAVCSQRAAA
jgi:cytochrome c biogenesis factor